MLGLLCLVYRFWVVWCVVDCVDFVLVVLVLCLGWMRVVGLVWLMVCCLLSWLLFKVCDFLIAVVSVIVVRLCGTVLWCCCLLLCLIVLDVLLWFLAVI